MNQDNADNPIAITYITLTKEQLESMLRNCEVGGVSQIKLNVSVEVLVR